MKEEFSIQNLLSRLREKEEKPEKVLKQGLETLLKPRLPEEKILKSLKELEEALKIHDEFNVFFKPSRKDKVVRVLKYFTAVSGGQIASKSIEGLVNGIIQLFERK